MDRFNWSEVQDYWKSQRSRAGTLDQLEDPDALGNVCHAGAPLWLNQYYARYQRLVFEQLLAACPETPHARALDVGCGAGRWCRILAARGYAVQGIDLQPSLIESNTRRYPDMKFQCVSVQDFKPEAPFDLISTVTVLQHIPFAEQRDAIAKIASMLKPGGHVLSLENINDQGVHVFANSIEEWTRLFQEAGCTRVAVRRYDYSPAIRLSSRLVNQVGQVARRMGLVPTKTGPEVPTAAPSDEAAANPGVGGSLRKVGWAARRAALTVDDKIEPLLIRLNPEHLPTIHCGFLFRRDA